MMLSENAFLEGLKMVRDAGIPASGKDIAVLAAHRAFMGRAEGKEDDPRFPVDAPKYAMRLIVDAYAMGGGDSK